MNGPDQIPLLDYAINIGIALVGGLVRFLREWRAHLADWDWKRTLIEWLVGGTTAGFVGLLTFLVLTSWGVDKFYAAFAVGIMGHMGPEGIDLLKEVVTNGLRSRQAPPAQPPQG